MVFLLYKKNLLLLGFSIILISLNDETKSKDPFSSFLDIIAGSAGGGAILIAGIIVLILVLINRSVFHKIGTLPKNQVSFT